MTVAAVGRPPQIGNVWTSVAFCRVPLQIEHKVTKMTKSNVLTASFPLFAFLKRVLFLSVVLSDHLKRKSLEIFRFRNHRDDGVVRALRIDCDTAQNSPGIVSGGKNHILKGRRVHVV